MLAHALLALALGASQQDAGHVQDVQDEASLSRIRSALSRPAILRLDWPCDPPAATFRLEVHAHPFFTERPWRWDFGGGGVAPAAPRSAPSLPGIGTAPLVVVDVLPLIHVAWKAHARHDAVNEVRRALEEFCSAHQCDRH